MTLNDVHNLPYLIHSTQVLELGGSNDCLCIPGKAKAQVASRVAPGHNIAPEEQLTEKVRSLVFLSWPPSHLDGANQGAFQRPWRLGWAPRKKIKQAERENHTVQVHTSGCWRGLEPPKS